MRRIFDEELQDLDNSFSQMGKMVARTVDKATNAFIDHDEKMAQSIIDRDAEINEHEAAIEKKSFEMIALYQPVSTDLREVITVLKVVSVLERVGDQARNIAQSTIRIKNRDKDSKRDIEIEKLLSKLSDQSSQSIDQVLDAYINDDAKAAEKVAASVDEIADQVNKIRNASIKAMQEDSAFVEAATDYIVVAGYLRRIADYSTDIAEWIMYKRTGKIVDLNPGSSAFL